MKTQSSNDRTDSPSPTSPPMGHDHLSSDRDRTRKNKEVITFVLIAILGIYLVGFISTSFNTIVTFWPTTDQNIPSITHQTLTQASNLNRSKLSQASDLVQSVKREQTAATTPPFNNFEKDNIKQFTDYLINIARVSQTWPPIRRDTTIQTPAASPSSIATTILSNGRQLNTILSGSSMDINRTNHLRLLASTLESGRDLLEYRQTHIEEAIQASEQYLGNLVIRLLVPFASITRNAQSNPVRTFLSQSDLETIEKTSAKLSNPTGSWHRIHVLVQSFGFGSFGASLFGLLSLSKFVGRQRFRRHWIPYVMIRPFVGGGLAMVFVVVLRLGSGKQTDDTDDALLIDESDVFSYGSVALLVGLFSSQAMEKLNSIADNLFSSTKDPDEEELERPVITNAIVQATNASTYNLQVRGQHFIPGLSYLKFQNEDRPIDSAQSKRLLNAVLSETDIHASETGIIDIAIVTEDEFGHQRISEKHSLKTILLEETEQWQVVSESDSNQLLIPLEENSATPKQIWVEDKPTKFSIKNKNGSRTAHITLSKTITVDHDEIAVRMVTSEGLPTREITFNLQAPAQPQEAPQE